MFASDNPTKKGHLMILTDATENTWERRWFVLKKVRRTSLYNVTMTYTVWTFQDHISTSMRTQMKTKKLQLSV